MSDFARMLAARCGETGAGAALERHYELLLRWNRVLNLTSIEAPEQIVERHYCESLFLAARLPAGALAIADVGSGAGFPGIPVAAARPDCRVTLIEAHQRKAVFLREATRGWANVRVLAARAESVVEQFDWAISRAVRLSQIERALERLAPRYAVLAGNDAPAASGRIAWHPPVPLPWGRSRMLWLGEAAPRS